MKTLTPPRPSTVRAVPPVRPRRRRPARTTAVWILAGPYALFLVVFGLAPAGYALWTSFVHDGSFSGGATGQPSCTTTGSVTRPPT